MADFALLESPKLISRKIWVTEKSWNFHTVVHIRKIANEVGLHKKEALEKKDDAKLMTDKKRASGAKKQVRVVS